MKRIAAFVIPLLLAAVTAAAAARARDEQRELTEAVDRLGKAIELRRISVPTLVASDRGGRILEVVLAADKRETRYLIAFEWSGKVISFMPKDFDYTGVVLGYDTLPKGPERDMCIRVTRPLGERLGWKWVSGPLIQRIRDDFVVTYITMTEEEQTALRQSPEIVFVHPYVSFLVTPKGKVFGGFQGA